MAHKLPPLRFGYDALEPYIDAETMELHHDKHHGAYVSNLNEAAKTAPQIAQRPIEYVLAHLADLPEGVRATVRNNMGGHANHSMYWTIMGPNGGEPDGVLLDAIERDLGGIAKLQDDFDNAGGKVFGSGWVFVTVTDGRLAIAVYTIPASRSSFDSFRAIRPNSARRATTAAIPPPEPILGGISTRTFGTVFE